jgi:predicted ATPase
MGPVFGGHDPGVCAHCCQANGFGMSGVVRGGQDQFDRAFSLAEKLKHPPSLAHVLHNETLFHQMMGNVEAVDRSAQRVIELAEKYNFPPVRAHGFMLSGWVQAVGHGSSKGLDLMEAEFPRATAIGPLFRCYAVLFAEARMKFKRFSDALTVIQWALGTVTEPGIGLWVSELYRLQGLCLLEMDSGNQPEAMNSLQLAVDVAKQQGANLLHLKAAISMAEAASALGQPEKAMASLHDLCANLPPDFDAPPLDEAKKLLSRTVPA